MRCVRNLQPLSYRHLSMQPNRLFVVGFLVTGIKRVEELVGKLKGTKVTGVVQADPITPVGEQETKAATDNGAMDLDLELDVDPIDLGPKISGSVYTKMNDTEQKDSWKRRKAGMDELQKVLAADKMVRLFCNAVSKLPTASLTLSTFAVIILVTVRFSVEQAVCGCCASASATHSGK